MIDGASNELLAFVPEQCEVVFGANVAALRNRPNFMNKFEDALKQSGANLTPAQQDLIQKADKAILALRSTPQQVVLAFTTTAPMDAAKVREAFGAGAPQTEEGRTFHPVNLAGGTTDWLALPNERTAVIATMPKGDMIRLLGGNNRLPPNMQNPVAANSAMLA